MNAGLELALLNSVTAKQRQNKAAFNDPRLSHSLSDGKEPDQFWYKFMFSQSKRSLDKSFLFNHVYF